MCPMRLMTIIVRNNGIVDSGIIKHLNREKESNVQTDIKRLSTALLFCFVCVYTFHRVSRVFPSPPPPFFFCILAAVVLEKVIGSEHLSRLLYRHTPSLLDKEKKIQESNIGNIIVGSIPENLKFPLSLSVYYVWILKPLYI